MTKRGIAAVVSPFFKKKSQNERVSYGKRREFIRIFLQQIYFTFVQSIPLVAILGIFSGVLISLQSQIGFSFHGDNQEIGRFLVFFIFREIAPLATGLILVTRSITALASELATMKIGEEVRALEYMGIDIYTYLLNPRIIAGSVSLFCMANLFWACSLIGGYFVLNIGSFFPLSLYSNIVAVAFTPEDILFFVLKSTIAGGIVVYYAGSLALNKVRASFEVPIVTLKAVINSLFIVIGLHVSLSLLYYLIFGI